VAHFLLIGQNFPLRPKAIAEQLGEN